MPAAKLDKNQFRVLVVDLATGQGNIVAYGDRTEVCGGSGLAADLFATYGLPDKPWDDPGQPLIFAIGPMTGYFPIMSKVVCGFKSPYHDQYTESHAGGRLALSIKFAGYDAVVIQGTAPEPSTLVIGSHRLDVDPRPYLWGINVFTAGKLLRRMYPSGGGHRSIMRIGRAGENKVAYACINVDSYRHFGRMGSGAVMGAKYLKAIVVQGEDSFDLPPGKDYAKLYQSIHEQMTATKLMTKYHDLGTAANLESLNNINALPWRNLQQTSDPAVSGISGEQFAEELLLRQTACAGCPVGCIHMGMLREKFGEEHEYQYRQVSYDYEPIFAMGSMIGITDAGEILALLDEVEKVGVDCMSCGVALAWATEALANGLVSTKETLVPLKFGEAAQYMEAVRNIGRAENEFYRLLGQGTSVAADHYGGEEFACVLGQEMGGYATGEVYFAAQGLGFRHSHLDTGGYSYDQKARDGDLDKALDFLISDEKDRCLLNSLVSCLFGRGIYSNDVIAEALTSIGHKEVAQNLDSIAARVQASRWQQRFLTGYDPHKVKISKRLRSVKPKGGPIDNDFLDKLTKAYATKLTEIGTAGLKVS